MFTKFAQPKAAPPRRGNPSTRHASGLGASFAVPSPTKSKPSGVSPLLSLEEHLGRRDFAAALTLLRVQQLQEQQQQQQQQGGKAGVRLLGTTTPTPDMRFWRRSTWWTAYCDFQRGDIHAALVGFDLLLGEDSDGSDADGGSEAFADPFVARDKLAWRVSRACCLFYLQELDAAEQQAMRLPRDALCNRLLFLLAHEKTRQARDESPSASALVLDRYSRLVPQTSPRDQLAVAFASFCRNNYAEAADAYKQLLVSKKTSSGATTAAVHVYLALCYYHLEYFDVATELLSAYLEANPGSFFATNIKASCHFRLYGADAALAVLRDFGVRFPHHPAASLLGIEGDSSYETAAPSSLAGVAAHNCSVFRQTIAGSSEVAGSSAAPSSRAPATETALQQYIDCFPEARTNLALLHLRNRRLSYALSLLEAVDPATDAERMTKGAILALVGEQQNTRDHVFLAEKLFHAIGSAPDSVDTIPGRQSMASYFLLRREFADALVYLESIASYLSPSSAAFNWNYGLCLAAVASSDAVDSETSITRYHAAQECLERARKLDKRLAHDVTLVSWLARCYVRGNAGNDAINGSHVRAWELYQEMEASAPATETRVVLKVVANEYYRSQRFYLAAKAFDALERREDPVDPEVWEAKRGACAGFFRQVATGEERDSPGSGVKTRAVVPPLLSTRMDEVLALLSRSSNTLEASKLAAMLKKWLATLKLRS